MRVPGEFGFKFAAVFALACMLCAVPSPTLAVEGDGSTARPEVGPLDEVDTWRSPGIDRGRMLVEDEIAETAPDAIYRVGVPFDLRLAPDNAGSWESLRDGSRLWRLVLESRDALWMVVGFGKYNLQPGARLFLSTPDRSTVLGPYTHENVRAHGELWFPPIDGDTVVVELEWPATLAGDTPNLVLTRVSHGYKPLDTRDEDPRNPLGESDPTRDLGDSGSCNIDAICPQAASWQEIKQGVVHILRGGTSWCSGSLILTTARDCAPYVLSAAHCFSAADAPSLTFRFNYERPSCGSGTPGTIQTVTGSTFRARSTATDFFLTEMDAAPPLDADAYFNGWDRSGIASPNSVGIHHPRGDAKKWSYNDDPLVNGVNYGSNHWRVTEWEQGTTEPTSSGSPLFDNNQRIVGQLHGGTASCTSITYDEYGKVSDSWPGGGSAASRLSDWLDPANTGEIAIDGAPYNSCLTPQPRLAVSSVQVDDSVDGNGNGVIDVGERVRLSIEADNGAGTLDATGVTGQLTSLHGDVAVTQGAQTFPDLAQGAASFANGPYEIEIATTFTCGDSFSLQIDLTANEAPGLWPSEFQLSTGVAQTSISYEDDMENGAAGWSVGAPTGSNLWAQTNVESSSPATSWFVSDIASVSDATLDSSAIAIPAGAQLRFRQLVRSESTYDGGVLEISTDGTTWSDLGGAATAGGYNSTISTQYSSPIGGRQAWSGTLGTSAVWPQVSVDLSSYAGQTAQFRWRFASDSSVDAEGWYIDDVAVDVTTYDCAPSLAVPGEASTPGNVPLAFDRSGVNYDLSWSAPMTGGPTEGYRLYAQPLANLSQAPTCEGDLGSGTSTTMPALPNDSAFLIVAYNGAGEGSYGAGSSGSRGSGSGVCP